MASSIEQICSSISCHKLLIRVHSKSFTRSRIRLLFMRPIQWEINERHSSSEFRRDIPVRIFLRKFFNLFIREIVSPVLRGRSLADGNSSYTVWLSLHKRIQCQVNRIRLLYSYSRKCK